jgi:hypothetical protein
MGRCHEDSRLHRIQRFVRPDDVGRVRLFSGMMRLAGPNATTPTARYWLRSFWRCPSRRTDILDRPRRREAAGGMSDGSTVGKRERAATNQFCQAAPFVIPGRRCCPRADCVRDHFGIPRSRPGLTF